VALGLLQAGLGRPAGFAQFGGTVDAFLASLAPLLGFLIVLCGALAWTGHWLVGLTFFLVLVCDLLAPAVIADLFCRLWHRREHWARYANVLNCTPWLFIALFMLLMPLAAASVSAGLTPAMAAAWVMAALGLYGIWFNWFAARYVLHLSRTRALLVTLAVILGTALILQIPVTLSELAGMKPASAALQAFGAGK
jgi:cytochrome c biogenesis factor